MFFLNILTLLLFVVQLSSSQSCNVAKTCVNNYKPDKIKFTGCSSTSAKSRVHCAVTCISRRHCASFNYTRATGDCTVCSGNMTLGLVFGGADTGHVLRRVSQTYWPQNVNNVNQSVSVPGGITLGSIVHLRGIYVNYTGFYVDFRQNDDSSKVNFHFRPRRDYDTGNPVIALSYCNNGVWGSETRPNISVYPFVVNQVFEVNILVRGDAFLVYINRVFFYSYPHVMPPEKINWIRVFGVVNVTELSV